MKILIVGNKGQLGWALEQSAARRGIPTIGVDLPELNLTSPEAVNSLVEKHPCTTVINAAAYTAVDKAEDDAEAAFAVNRDGAAHLAYACRKNGIPLIHISTDYVFDGKGSVPYKPENPIEPLGVYGKSKAFGEKAVRDRLAQHIIVRTSWLYGVHGHNFVKTMLRLAREKKELRVVNDQRGCPTFAGDLANALVGIAERVKTSGPTQWGTHHFCNGGVISWYQFAKQAIAAASVYENLKIEKIIPITTADYPTAAPRPLYSALDCSSFTTAFGIEMVPWKDSLSKMIAALYSA